MEETEEVEYLGDIVSGDSKNTSNIKNRVAKGTGIINNIFNILDNVSFGQYYFKIALILREAMLVNAVLYNCSVWYNLSKKDLKELDDLDKLFFSRLFQVPRQSPFESFFLETGVISRQL